MKKLFVYGLIAILLFAVFTACGKNEPKEVFGECIISADYEDLTQEEYTTYLQEAYGLDTLLAHKVYHSNGNFQVDFKFSKDVKDVKEWQLDSARKFAIDKFYSRDIAKYDLWNYDVWLIEHLEQESISVTYRIFTESKLTTSGRYPDETYPINDAGLTYGPDIKDNTNIAQEPDLIQVCNEDGLVGYIYASDIKDGAESLEEAINWEPRTYKVPMYLEDGTTVIGEFTIDGNIEFTGTQASSPSPAWNGEFTIELPEGFTITTDENGNQIYSDGTQTVGGMTIRTIPEGFEITEYFKKDFLITLGIEEAADESLGYYGEGSTGGMGPWGWTEEYFSDVADPKDRTVHTSHQFFIMSDEKTVLDFWFDLMLVDHVTKDLIFESIEIPEIERYRQEPILADPIPETLPFEFPLPDGYAMTPESDNTISIIQNGQVIGGIIRTDLDVNCITDTDCTHIDEYLKSFASYPLFVEYINMYFDGIAYISLQISDYETGPISSQSHSLFNQDAVCFDYWVDNSLVTHEERDSIFKSILGK